MADDRDDVERTTVVTTDGGGGGGGVLAVVLLIIVVVVLLFLFRDQLGFGSKTTEVKVPDQIDVQRAREILEELRRRIGESTRPPIELEYLERLLRRF